ncbi:putative PSP1 C-terminal conserved region containing protein [Leishmania shawi]|uniref:PSP1 C-terminal conserved region containing protein n=1 Tax=Leishmania shawi TaxID=5680 RepID=A0AAW3BG61_9TRYP
MTPKRRALSACAAVAGNPGDDSAFLSISRTPGHNVTHHPALSSGSSGCRPMQQRQRGLTAPHSTDTSAAAATPNQARQRPSRVARAALLASPLYATSGGVGTATSIRTSDVQPDNGSVSPLPLQSSLLCTPNRDSRSAAAAATVATGTRAPLDTSTCLEEIPLFLNSFESGSESPTRDAVAVGGYSATQTTPYRTYDLQRAVEEMLRNCLDSFTPAKGSDRNEATPYGSRRGAAQWRQAAPFNAYAGLESLFSPSTVGAGRRDGSSIWAPAMPECTPDRLTVLQGAFAESDGEEVLTTPRSDRASCGIPSAGVRRDPMVYFSTAAVAVVDSSESPRGVKHDNEVGVESIGNLSSGRGGCGAAAESMSQHSSSARSGFEYNCHDGSSSGPDVLTMLAAAVQQQHPEHHHRNTETRPPSARSTMGSMGLGSRTILERDVTGTRQQQSMKPPPSYDITAHHHKPLHHDSSAHPGYSSASSCTATRYALPPPRPSHRLPHVKAAAGSLIAVGGRRVPVDKLHLLSIGDEPPVGQAAAEASLRGGPKSRSQQLSSPLRHVEGPSMRRVPKASLVTVTLAGTAGQEETAVPVAPGRHASAPANRHDAPFPESSASSNVSEAAPARVAVTGPSARRVPPAMATQRRCSSGGAAAGVASLNSALDGEGVRKSSELDVVAVLQFPKGQTMRFLTNLSPTALETAKSAVTRDRARSKRFTAGTATSVLASKTLLRSVEVGKTYLAHVYTQGSPHKGVSYEDVGVCVQLITSTSPLYTAQLGCVDGILLRKVDVFMHDEDRRQHERVLQQQTTAYIECERQFKFSNLPFQLESIYFTFDGSVCIIFYRVVGVANWPSSTCALYCHPNTSRVIRELQFHLNCRVFLKQC